MNHDSVGEIKKVLNQKGLALKKRWGQNFMINRGAREKLINLLNPEQNELIWEIGPGLGSMTELLIQSRCNLICFEIDQGLIKNLKEKWGELANFKIIEGDAVKTWHSALKHGVPKGIIGNLPYASSSKIIGSIIEKKINIDRMIFTVQKELADRMTANPGNKNYASFSIFCQFSYDISYQGELKSGSFFPAPDVTSSIIKLVPKQRQNLLGDLDLFYKIVRSSFFARRKTLFNNLHKIFPPSLIKQCFDNLNMDEKIRGEQLSIEDYINLTNEISKTRTSE